MGIWCSFKFKEVVGDGWVEIIREKWFLKICRNRFNFVVISKVNNIG